MTPRRSPLAWLLGAFLTGLLFLAPVLLTIVLLQWLAGQIAAVVGPDSLVGQALASGGMFVASGVGPLLAFWIGVAIVLAAIALLGMVVQTRARATLERGLDRLIDRVPLLRGLYRPLAQLVRLFGQDKGEMKGMRAVVVRFGGHVDVPALQASPSVFTVNGEPRLLILVPTAPVPVGGALIFVPPDAVREIPGLGVEELVAIYVSMGVAVPPALRPAPSNQSRAS